MKRAKSETDTTVKYFQKLSSYFLKNAHHQKQEVCRIDLRLRPDGKSSSVCRSIQEYLDYYEIRGSDWERQMLIKAGFLGGNEKLYSQFMKYIDRFVYPAVHFVSPLEQMKKLRKIIERDSEDANIKLIPGGIRDIEFTVQALQLLNGGRDESIKSGNTFSA